MFNAVKEQMALPASIPTVVAMLLALLSVAMWAGSYWLSRRMAGRGRSWQIGLWLTRIIVGGGAILMVMLAISHRGADGQGLVLWTTSWPIWPMALAGSLAVDVLMGLYRVERQTAGKRAGRVLAALRIVLPLMVVFMLAQPVLPLEGADKNRRVVAVLLDTSASMQLSDRQMPAAEKLRLAEMLGVAPAARPCRLEQVYQAVEKLRLELAAQGDWFAQITPAAAPSRQQQLESRRDLLNKTYAQGLKTLESQVQALDAVMAGKVKLSDAAKAGLIDIKANLGRQVRDAMTEAGKVTDSANAAKLGEQLPRLTELTRSAVTSLTVINPKLAAMANTVDEAYFASLAAPQQAQIDAAVKQTRLALARQVLLTKSKDGDKPGPSLLDKLNNKYLVRVYQFAARAEQAEIEKSASPTVTSSPATAKGPATAATSQPEILLDPAVAQTDLAGAIQKVLSDVPARQLAGIVILSDGRHNAPAAVEPVAERLAQQQVPVSTVLIGSQRPPCDAGIVSVQAPKVVYAKDKMYIDAEVKLDGLAGKTVRVSLLDGQKEVAFKALQPAGDSLRTHVELSDEPKSVGLHTYQVRVDNFPDEVFTTNNAYSLTVSVTEEQTKLLIVEGRPRWEFRYLKNLFADRDKTVRLQYVLLEPDKIEGQGPRAMVYASAAAPAGQSEATALPKDEKEWMKFDAVILGDVSPSVLTAAQQEMLRKFVCDRGGTLVVVGGRFHMPHEYVGQPIESLLPVTFRAGTGGGDEMFRFALTEAGKSNVVLRLKVDSEDNAKFWQTIPEVNWRNTDVLSAKPGSTVLAFAAGADLPEFMKTTTATEEILRQRRDFESRQALIVTQNVAMGQVMYLNTDRTWRLRYRTGDTYHHKFWGQVLRWATASKLPAGTDYVKLGSDQARYSPHAPVQARAKLLQRDFTPLPEAEVAVAVYNSANQVVLRRKLQYMADSPGSYQATLGELPGGQYRMELEAPEAAAILAADKVEKVSTEFSVDPAPMDELIELSADRALPGRLATLTGGVLVEPPQAMAVADSMGQDVQVLVQARQLVLWDHWMVLALFAALVTVEWVIRKKVGLP